MYLSFYFWYNLSGVNMSRSKRKNNKKIIKTIVIILIIIIILALIGYYLYDKKQKEIEANRLKITLIEDLKVEVNSEVKLNEFINTIINGEVLNGEA